MIYLAGIDTLVIGFYLRAFNLTEDDYIDLKESKEKAKAPAFKSAGFTTTFQKVDFVMSPAGQRPYTYVLQNCDFTLKLAQKVSNGGFPEVFIEFRSGFLWKLGYKQASVMLQDIPLHRILSIVIRHYTRLVN